MRAKHRPRNHFGDLEPDEARNLLDFLGSLIIFPPDDTASNLDPGQFKDGRIKMAVRFNDAANIK
jgi:hypothetical protein